MGNLAAYLLTQLNFMCIANNSLALVVQSIIIHYLETDTECHFK